MQFTSVDDLRRAGFEGFHTFATLRASRLAEVPRGWGVYAVIAEPRLEPQFLSVGSGGYFKGKNPNVPVAVLAASWVPETIVLNIGKAGGTGSSSTLQKRLDTYLKFGAGKPVGHYGGRYIWQLAGCEMLQLCWMVTEREPRDVERELIETFSRRYGKRPFANLQD